MATFKQLGVRAEIVAALAAQDITEAFPIQAATLTDALAGHDLCGKADTGSGKTLAFGIALLQRTRRQRAPRRPAALVLVPTRELASQVLAVLKPLAQPLGLRADAFYGGVSIGRQLNVLSRGIDVVVATPGRLNDLIGQRALSLDSIATLVIDEADRMADMGFMPQIERVLNALPAHQTLLFSATLDGDVDVLVRRHMKDPVRHEVVSTQPTVEQMDHRFLGVEQTDRLKVVASIARGVSRTIVFVRTKRGADRVALQLGREGVPAAAIHGGLRQSQRERALKAFMSGNCGVLVATDVAARGIHVDGIDVVVHYDLPQDHKAYLHRSGRTARAGADGMVATLVTREQKSDVRVIQEHLALRHPIVQVSSGDHRLGDLGSIVSVPLTASAAAAARGNGDHRQTPRTAQRRRGRSGARTATTQTQPGSSTRYANSGRPQRRAS